MRVLFIFPHPDDECFGPGPLLWKLRRTGHEAHLLTLTQGEATKERDRLGVSKREMGAIRTREMGCVARVLGLASMEVLGYPDGELAGLDPLDLEATVDAHVRRVRPHVVVTYAVHGNSVHPDHLATHAVVKRVVAALRRAGDDAAPQRLALFTLAPSDDPARPAHLRASPWERIALVEVCADEDFARGQAALDCYETYRRVVEAHNPLRQVRSGICFELFGEAPAPRRDGLFDDLPHGASEAP